MFFNKIKVLGAGSNTLIRDGAFDGIIIKLGKPFAHLSLFNDNTLIAGAAALDKNVSNFALEHSLTGLEFLSCIPGSIGGGIRMNSGCYGEDISKILISVQVMDLDGKIKVICEDGKKYGEFEISEDKAYEMPDAFMNLIGKYSSSLSFPGKPSLD